MRVHPVGPDGMHDEVDMFDDTVLDLSGGGLQASDVDDDEYEADQDSQTDLVWWLAQLAIHDRERYLRLREVAWLLVAENTDRSVIPN